MNLKQKIIDLIKKIFQNKKIKELPEPIQNIDNESNERNSLVNMNNDQKTDFLNGIKVENSKSITTTNIEEVENPEQVMKNKPIIGLFGTCGGSKWRDKFIESYSKKGIYYFNPNKTDWNPECAKAEAKHLAEDEIILFPVTSETYGTGSLAEVGFSIIQAIEKNRGARIVIMIDKQLDESLDNSIAKKESVRARAIISEHLAKTNYKNVYVTEDLEEMLEISEGLYKACEAEKEIRNNMEKKREAKMSDKTKD